MPKNRTIPTSSCCCVITLMASRLPHASVAAAPGYFFTGSNMNHLSNMTDSKARRGKLGLLLAAGTGLVWAGAAVLGALAGALLAAVLLLVALYGWERAMLGRAHSAAALARLQEDEREAAVRRATRALLARQTRTRFLATVGHELRQPLFALTLYGSVLQRHLGPDQASLGSNIKECVDSLKQLITDLLELGSLDIGMVEAHPHRFAVDDLLRQTGAAHLVQAQSKGLSLRWRVAGWTAQADFTLLRHLLDRLVASAVREACNGGVLLACRRRQGKTWLEVWDTGAGMNAEQSALMTEQFNPQALPNASAAQGSRLGLIIVARTAALMGLQVRVHSRQGRGTMFALELPLAPADRT